MVITNLKQLFGTLVKGPATLENYQSIHNLSGKKFEEIVGTGTSVVFLIRRLGCPVCRATALTLSCAKNQIEAAGGRLVAVTHQDGEELNEYLKGKFFNGELYYDQDKKTFESAGLVNVTGLFSALWGLFSFSSVFKSRTEIVPGNMNEIKLIASAILVISGKRKKEKKKKRKKESN